MHLCFVYFTLKRCMNLFTFMPVKDGSVFSWFMTLHLPKSKMLLCLCHYAINTIIYPSGCQDAGHYLLEMQSGSIYFFSKYFRGNTAGNKTDLICLKLLPLKPMSAVIYQWRQKLNYINISQLHICPGSASISFYGIYGILHGLPEKKKELCHPKQ